MLDARGSLLRGLIMYRSALNTAFHQIILHFLCSKVASDYVCLPSADISTMALKLNSVDNINYRIRLVGY